MTETDHYALVPVTAERKGNATLANLITAALKRETTDADLRQLPNFEHDYLGALAHYLHFPIQKNFKLNLIKYRLLELTIISVSSC